MKIIFHIGMGKTGTSSIQHALSENRAALAAKSTHYFGMWFSELDPSYRGFDGQAAFLQAAATDPEGMADRFCQMCRQQAEKRGTETFILSNEGLFGHVSSFAPFVSALTTLMDVSLVMYVRDPRAWLPSAYTQWGIRHKEQPGEVQGFAERARVLIGQYSGVRLWNEAFPDHLIAREHAKGLDVVQDFANVIGIPLAPPKERVLERAEDAEILLRAVFNNRFKDPVLPERFSRVVLNTSNRPAADVGAMIERCFDMSSLDDVLKGASEDLAYLKDTLGMDFTSTGEAPAPPDETAIKTRMVDYLVEITLQQSLRLQKLERQLKNLNG
ncbi:MAG: hypothetical protein ACPGVA_01675 [Pikeienuella sp.]